MTFSVNDMTDLRDASALIRRSQEINDLYRNDPVEQFVTNIAASGGNVDDRTGEIDAIRDNLNPLIFQHFNALPGSGGFYRHHIGWENSSVEDVPILLDGIPGTWFHTIYNNGGLEHQEWGNYANTYLGNNEYIGQFGVGSQTFSGVGSQGGGIIYYNVNNAGKDLPFNFIMPKVFDAAGYCTFSAWIKANDGYVKIKRRATDTEYLYEIAPGPGPLEWVYVNIVSKVIDDDEPPFVLEMGGNGTSSARMRMAIPALVPGKIFDTDRNYMVPSLTTI